MSAEEKALAIGRLVLQASESKTNLAALKSALAEASEQLRTALEYINGEVDQGITYPSGETERAIRALPTSEKILQILDEYRSERRRYAELKSQLGDLNF